MEQNTNKENLRKLLDFLQSHILSNPSNHWFAKDLYKILAPISDARISDIHEQCIEAILKEQATEFYKDFVIPEIRPQLISDFIKMEHWRRRNNIREFGLAAFQQIEGIINRLSLNNTLDEVSRNMMNAPCYIEDNNIPNVINRKSNSTYTISQLLFIDQDKIITKSHRILSEHWIIDKFKVINYFICHKACLTNHQFNQFVNENSLFGEIYALRNLNHRGNELTENDKERLKNFKANPSRAFLTITSFLCWFVDSINQGYPLSNELIEFSKTESFQMKKPSIDLKILGKIEIKEYDKKRVK
ncbi:MAG: hypothetical protein K2K27_02630 [Muribaculaceae bacterium]|nr:hypothetical protein [Muribaculaceae bacterium]